MCVFSITNIKFLGHVISKEGIQIDPEKLKVIIDLPRSKNVWDLRCLLGMANQVGKFAKHLADTTSLLREILKKETELIWGELKKISIPNHKETTEFHTCTESLQP